ncbi:MAG: OsmC family protein [Chloroflexi bacterium]|nr:OsmC family protein [Chloroflexota bacterium]
MSIADAVARARAYLAEHPGEARYRDAHARARLSSGLVVDVDGPGGESLRTDMPRGIGGTATLPSPGWYLRAAAASCVVSLMAIRAATLGMPLAPGSVEVVVDSESDDRGILGLDDSVPAGALSVRIVVRVDPKAIPAEQAAEIARWAVDHCPVTEGLRREVPLELELSGS